MLSQHYALADDSVMIPLPQRPTLSSTPLDGDYSSQLDLRTHQVLQEFEGCKLDDKTWQNFWGELHHAEESSDQPEGLDFGFDVACGLPTAGELPSFTHHSPDMMLSPDDLKLGDNLTHDQEYQLRQFLWEEIDVFAFLPEQLGKCETVIFDIQLKPDSKPKSLRPYRMSPKEQAALRQEIDKMLELGLIVPSDSPWGSPPVMVKKPDGSYRVTINYKYLNSLCEQQSWPLPRLLDILDNLGKAAWFCSMDCCKGFFQLCCSESSAKYAAINTPWGTYEPRRMMQGLRNSPPTWMRCMQIGLAEHLGVRCFAYLDDLVTFGETFEDMLNNTRLVFASLRKMGLTLAPSKCVFGAQQLRFLGHMVDAQGCRPDPRLIKSIQEYPRPKTRTQIYAFLGLAGFYRRFVKDFALLAGPMYELTKQNVPMIWGEEQEKAFQDIKTKLGEWPVLRRPDFDLPFYVKTDACKLGFGAILCQKDDSGKEYVVAYASRKTKPPEQNYSASELECAAVVWALTEKFRPYIYGDKFYLITDHKALSWLMSNSSNLTGRLARWSLRLQEFSFEIQYRPGTQHKDVDALSRAFASEEHPQEDPDEPATDQAPTETPEKELPDMLQMTDLPTEDSTPPNSIDLHRKQRGSPPTATPILEEFYTTETPSTPTCDEILDTDQTTPTMVQSLPGPDLQTPEALNNTQDDSDHTTTKTYKCITDFDDTLALHGHIRISIEGNIGCGKSSTVSGLRNSLPSYAYNIHEEPVGLWNEDDALAHFYEANTRYSKDHFKRWQAARDLQLIILKSYIDMIHLAEENQCTIMERGTLSSLTVFTPLAKMHSRMEAEVYQAALDNPLFLNTIPHLIIYIDVPAAVCLNRIKSRGILYEKDVTLTYLQQIEDNYSSMLSNFKGPVKRIDGTMPRNQVLQHTLRAIDEGLKELELLCTSSCNPVADPYWLLPELPLDIVALHKDGPVKDEEFNRGMQADIVRNTDPSIPVETHQVIKYPGGSIISALAGEKSAVNLWSILSPKPYGFDPENQALVLFQYGPGVLAFNDDFATTYRQRYKEDIMLYDRVDNFKLLELMNIWGWSAAAFESARFAIAAVPRRGLDSLTIYRTKGGAEFVAVNPDTHAIRRFNMSIDIGSMDSKALLRAYQDEGHRLNQQIVIFRTIDELYNRQPMPSGQHEVIDDYYYSLRGIGSPPFKTDDFFYTFDEDTAHRPKQGRKARTPATVLRGGGEEPTSDDELFSCKSKSSVETEETGDTIDIDLPCEICRDPGRWECMLLCEDCTKGYHFYCVGLSEVPSDQWYCPRCQNTAEIISQELPKSAIGEQELIDLTVLTSSNEENPAALATTLNIDSCTQVPTVEKQSGEIEAVATQELGLTSEVIKEPQNLTVEKGDIFTDPLVLHYLKTGEIIMNNPNSDPDLQKKTIRRVMRRANNYRFENGLFYKLPSKSHPVEREVPPPRARAGICRELHNDHGHMGVKRMLDLVGKRWFWHNMTQDIKAVTQNCDACARKGIKLKSREPELKPIPPMQLFERICVDTCGPFPVTPRGAKWIIIAVCHWSKYVWARALPKKKSELTARFFLEEIIAQVGLPKVVVSDQGGEFLGQFEELLKDNGIEHKTSSAYHPRGNGLSEKIVQNILHGLQRAAIDDPSNWDLQLPWILLGQRAVKQASTKFSPMYLLYSREARLPAEGRRLIWEEELELPSDKANIATAEAENNIKEEELQKKSEALNKTAAQAYENITQAQERQKRDYKRRRGQLPKPSDIMPKGSMVLLKTPAKHKLSAGCEGPYRLLEYQSDTRAILEDSVGTIWPCHVNRIFPYTPTDGKSSLPKQL
jgi:deoxyadenosine/deoxycytidine kinase/transposase InsO family protein